MTGHLKSQRINAGFFVPEIFCYMRIILVLKIVEAIPVLIDNRVSRGGNFNSLTTESFR